MLTFDRRTLPFRYKYIADCGEGAAGSVIKIYDTVTEETRALKILKSVSASDRELFAEEFRTLSRLHHPNLVQVYDFGSLADGSTYFTMDYIEGTPIQKIFDDSSLEQRAERFAEVCLPILSAIGYVHSAGKVHGDIKPSNILVGSGARNSYDVYVVDFGIAALDQRNDGISGTIEYIAPEVLRGGHLNERTDIYSLGVLFYELLTGKLPFAGSPDDVIKGHLQSLAPFVSSQNNYIPKTVDAIIEKMLRKEEHLRWQTVQEIEQAFFKELHPQGSGERHALHSWIPGSLYGRQNEWLRLLHARDISKRQTCAIRLTADAGIGKTRLLKEFAVDAMIAGCVVFQLQLHEHDTAKDIAI